MEQKCRRKYSSAFLRVEINSKKCAKDVKCLRNDERRIKRTPFDALVKFKRKGMLFMERKNELK